MYAVIQSGGKQYRVAIGDKLRLEALPHDEGATVEFDKVLAVGDGAGIEVGTPHLSTTVTGKVLANGKGKKIRVTKFKRRKNYERNHGHRQLFTEVEITGIGGVSASASSSSSSAQSAPAPAAQPEPEGKLEAAATAAAAAAVPVSSGESDDLTRINGIGPVLKDKLNALGITTFAQIADLTPDGVAEIDEQLNFKGRIEREEWIEQAKKLV